MLLRIAVALSLLFSTAAHAAELRAADTAPPGSLLAVEVIGDVDPKSFVSIVEPEAADGAYRSYSYTTEADIATRVPAETGDFELRLMAAESPYAVLSRQPLRVQMPSATLQAPAEMAISAPFSVSWSGPGGSKEYITLVEADAPDDKYTDYVYLDDVGSGEISLATPAQPGAYEVRYLSGHGDVVYARQSMTVTDSAASLSFSPSALMGSSLSVEWIGPGNPRDFITVVAPDADQKTYKSYAYTTQSPVQIVLPETPGRYEVRYLSEDSSRIYARAEINVSAAQATLKAPSSVVAHTEFEVEYSGPNNEGDYIAVTEAGHPKKYITYSYTRRGSPLKVRAPREVGEYDVHYLTGKEDISLASSKLSVTPGAAFGTLRVVGAVKDGAAADPVGSGTAHIELILDASGSMLQKIGSQRRIELAKDALKGLIQRDIASGTPVALRVFGHSKPDSCDTELVQSLAPLDRVSMSAAIESLEAKNLAKTPIGASLAAVADDLAGVEGSAIVVLVTDGEETCGGDPAAEINRLRQLGFAVTLNIVGFAVDEYTLEQQFRSWAELGGGSYFSAADGAGLADSVRAALRPPFAVFQGDRQVASGVVGGPPVELRTGRYQVRVGGVNREVEVGADQESSLRLK